MSFFAGLNARNDETLSCGPLEGVTILDLTWVLSGPYASMVLCDLGAEVIKLERPPRGDVARTTLPINNGESGYFFSINRGKKSMSIDLTKDEGKELFLRLVEKVDVVMENFTPGTMDNLGLGYEALSARNPRLIYAATSGFGQTGPGPRAPRARHRRAGDGRRDEHHPAIPAVRPRGPGCRSATSRAGCSLRSACWRRCTNASAAARAR